MNSTTPAPDATILTQASKQWASRPADERFWNLNEMMARTKASHERSRESYAQLHDSSFGTNSTGDLLIHSTDIGKPVELGHYAFGQVCRTLKAPADFLRQMPSALTAGCLNEKAKDFGAADRLLLTDRRDDGSEKLRAMTSDKYARVWNWELVQALQGLESEGWIVPPARPSGPDDGRTRLATEDDVLSFGEESVLTVKVGDEIAPAGLYASDHDMFAFMVNPEIQIEDGSSPQGLRRGTMIRQSEVGDCAIWKLDFLFNTVCGNHIVWDAQQVKQTRVRHIGKNVGTNWVAMIDAISKDAEVSASVIEGDIKRAQEMILGEGKDEIIELLFGKRLLAKHQVASAYDLAEEYEAVHGNPRSVWGVVQGLTRLSQQQKFTDARTKIDLAAGKVLATCLS